MKNQASICLASKNPTLSKESWLKAKKCVFKIGNSGCRSKPAIFPGRPILQGEIE
jgi:hypothetical protein